MLACLQDRNKGLCVWQHKGPCPHGVLTEKALAGRWNEALV